MMTPCVRVVHSVWTGRIERKRTRWTGYSTLSPFDASKGLRFCNGTTSPGGRRFGRDPFAIYKALHATAFCAAPDVWESATKGGRGFRRSGRIRTESSGRTLAGVATSLASDTRHTPRR
ncbi:unnamed protein product, partial [Iphiclides podalirius]